MRHSGQVRGTLVLRDCMCSTGVQRADKRKHPLSRWLSLTAVALCVSGCAITPEAKRSLAAYVQASTEVEQAANLFLTDFADDARIASEFDRIANGPAPAKPDEEYPSEFVPASKADPPPTKFDQALADSRQALGVIREYNEALVALAEGRPVSEIKGQIEELGGSISASASLAGFMAPGISQFAAIGAEIIRLAQDARNLEQLKSAVAGGRGPIEKILDVFEGQTKSIYRLSVVGAIKAQVDLRQAIARTTAPMKSFLKRYGPPTDATLFAEVAGFQQEVERIGERTQTINAVPNPFQFDDTQSAYDQEAHTEMKVFMSVLRASDSKYREIVAKQNAYYDLMEKYVAALSEMRNGLALVQKSLENPVDFRGQISRLLQSAFALRDAMSEFRHPSQSTL